MKDNDSHKADVNPAMRHDPPSEEPRREEEARPRDEQVKPTQGKELNPLDPGGIGG